MRIDCFGPAGLAMTIAVGVALLAGCESQPTEVEDYQRQAVLTAYLENGKPVTQIYLQWVATPLGVDYDEDDWGIDGAEVLIFPVSGSAPQDTLHLVQNLDPSWIYIPEENETEFIPQGKSRYRIEVRQDSLELYLWAEATVPDSVFPQITPPPIAGDTLDTLTREDPNIMFNWETPDSVGGYVVSILALTELDSLIPLDPEFEVGVDSLEEDEKQRNSINFGRYDQTGMVLGWMYFSWVGWTRVDFQAVSSEYYDYMLSIFRSMQGFPIDLVSNVHGGLGIVAGIASKSFWVYMERVE